MGSPVILNIGAVIDASTFYGRGVLHGVGQYACQHPQWQVHYVPAQITRWDAGLAERVEAFAGVVLQTPTGQAVEGVAQVTRPAVNVADHAEAYGLATVRPDHQAVGAMAARYFLELGYRNLAYSGRADEAYAQQREAGFVQTADKAGLRVARHCVGGKGAADESWCLPLKTWLVGLPKPAGVFACDDSWARVVATFCQYHAITVPEQVAILGVDDDPQTCEGQLPHLSSVATDSLRIGFVAAGVLAALLAGEAKPPRPLLVAPSGITTRQSTATVPTDDKLVQRAARVMREHCGVHSGSGFVAEQLRVAPEELDRRMVRVIGRSVAGELRRLRVERAKHLLRATDVALRAVAVDCGFTDAASFARDFRQETGVAPSEYRLHARLASGGPGPRAHD